MVRRMNNGDIVATGAEPGCLGEEVTLHLIEAEGGDVRARIVESRPVVVDGLVRHQMRLATVEQACPAVNHATRHGDLETE